MPSTPIQAPAAFVPSHATAFADIDGTSVLVSKASPLPITTRGNSAAPLSGSASTSGVLGPFVPAPDRPVMLSLAGTWAGTVKVTRSTDGGTTRLPLTVAGNAWGQFTANCCEAVWAEAEDTAQLYLDVTLISGTLTYRMAQ